MGGRSAGALAVIGLLAGSTVAWTGVQPLAGGKVVLVKMVDVSATDYRFDPSAITVAVGDTIRFQQTGSMPHNVEFRETPSGSALGAAKSSPYLVASGETYDLPITRDFVAGRYTFTCVPHEALGMKGSITVTLGK